MIEHGSAMVWSPSDLTSAAACEYGFLTALDQKLGLAPRTTPEVDPLLDEIARLGTAHEQRVTEGFRARFGAAREGAGVRVMERAPSARAEDLRALAVSTRAAIELGPDVLCQAGFFDGEFHGYADFLRRTTQGWVVADTKVARSAKTSALLQIAAYSDQLVAWGFPVAGHAELILGTGETQAFPLADIVPVFRERRERLRVLIADHLAVGRATAWDAPGVRACGSCAACAAGAAAADDVILVAGLRMAQRRRLKDAGIHTVPDLVSTSTGPSGMARSTFEKLRAQATLQWAQMQTEREGEPQVTFEVFDEQPIRAMPAPSPGDLFFDFEGDPMYTTGGSTRWGLEYLWGVLRAREPDGSPGAFWPLWADDRSAERDQLVTFLDEVAAVRAQHPEMHVYHYAPYEITALKRLVAEHKTREAELDDLLRHGVFVDLYAVVRASVRVSQPSYSIKKLEPLYMSHERSGDVTQGDASVAEYHRYRDLVAQPDEESRIEARRLKESLLDYNRYDCESTLELRDWLLARVGSVVPEQVEPEQPGSEVAEQTPSEEDLALVRLRASLLDRVGAAEPAARSDTEQAWAMLEGSLGYHQREARPYWWAHFDRLLTPAEEWADTKDVLHVDDASVVEPWTEKVGNKLPRRTLSLRGTLGPASTVEPPSKAYLLYDVPAPLGVAVPVRGLRGSTAARDLIELEALDDGTVRAIVVEAVAKGQATFDALPVAAAPPPPPSPGPIVGAIRSVAERCDAAGELVPDPAVDILARRDPRLATMPGLPHTGDRLADLVAGLRDLDRSYLAVQGPPGTGKTFLGSRVIRDLVTLHGWRVGVVGPSHAVVENMLDAIVKAGLGADLVGKRDKRAEGPHSTWCGLGDAKNLQRFCEGRQGGYVIGGTAWTFTGSGVDRDSLDLIVIDEAGQFSLANTVGVSVAAPRMLLLGDPQQLPQVSQGYHGEPVDTSALSWVIGGHATMPRHLGYFLETSYRMHPAVCRAVSRLSYRGELVSAPAASARSMDGVAPGVEVVRLDHRECSVSSREEADEVVRQAGRLLGTHWHDPDDPRGARPLGQEDVLVVAPYNAQRRLVRTLLDDAGLPTVRVGTVDKFQGQEAPVVIVSMTASSAEDVPRGLEFLLNRNRINVAISRAQWLAVVIRSSVLTAHMPSTPERLLELGGFIGVGGATGVVTTGGPVTDGQEPAPSSPSTSRKTS